MTAPAPAPVPRPASAAAAPGGSSSELPAEPSAELSAASSAAGGPRTRTRPLLPFGGPPTARLGGCLMALLVLAAVVGRIWTPFDPQAPGVGLPYLPPGGRYWFGTDQAGSDVFSKTVAATWTDLWLTLVAVAIAFVLGSLLGAIAGYWGGWADAVIMRVTEVLQSFPALLLALLLVTTLGSGLLNVIVVVAFVGLPGYLRLLRAEVKGRRTWEFTEAAVLAGNSGPRVLARHLVPNGLAPLVSYAAVNAAWVAIVVSSLGFVGVGIEPGSPEWGSMIAGGKDAPDAYWISLFPGLGILLLAAAFYLLGDGLIEREDHR
ncbi:ABC transporter permease [Actinacidiphila sp. ITFR-21]|uniref:ABC transporter permease n=1 Tax=Actinacidiphila sp. ITFR-21 TaxID=3075199 RepID=UPI00288B77C4|nr:ABC transporter permease [Streptomyces sp. ITFR-21]WNI18799.1 ABC transporter permease [Streptomyces sp. ITFR-21]